MASTIFRLDSRVFSTLSVKNRLQLLHDSCGAGYGNNPKAGNQHQHRVQHTDTGKIPERPEMGYPFRLRGIVHMDRNVFTTTSPHAAKTMASNSNSYLAGVPAACIIHLLERVETVSRLCIFQFQPGFQSEPEIREFIGEGILARHIVGGQVSGTYQQRVGLFLNGFDKTGNIGSEMLSVRIYGDGIAETLFFCLGKTMLQSGSFSFIHWMGNSADSRILFQNVGCIIRRAVIDDNDIVCIPVYLLN